MNIQKEKRCLDARTNLSSSFRDWFQKEGKINSKAKPYSWKSLQADKLQGKQNTLFKN